MNATIDNLQQDLDAADLAFLREAAAEIPPEPEEDGIRPEAMITHDLRFERRTRGREMMHALHVANAAEHIRSLPKPGWSLHCIMRGNYNAWDLIPAILELAGTHIRSLYVATLGFNQQNGAELCSLIDQRRIRAVTFICSHYFQNTSPEIFGPLATEMARRRQRILAVRCHAKILAIALGDGRHLVIESSANLRSCNNIEQFTLTHDRKLYEFHRTWMDSLFE